MPNAVETADAPRPYHRHWVIWPLFLSAMAVSSSLGVGYLEQPAVASAGLPEGGGEVLVRDDGMIAWPAGNLVFFGMHGAFTVSEQAGHMSVAALTTPVLVRGMDAWSIVPIGFQWRSEKVEQLLPLPLAFQYAKLQELRDDPSSPPLARLSSSLILPGALRFPAAKQRREDMVRKQHLSTVVRHVARGYSIASLVQDGAMRDALSSDEGYRVLPILLAQLPDVPLDRAALFPLLAEKEEGALLTLFHPSFRDQAALFALDSLSLEARAAYHRTLPLADLLPDALSRLVFSQWEEDITRELPEFRDPLPFFATLLDTVENVVRECARRGYVERAQRYIAAMQHLSTLVRLTPELHERLDALPDFLDVLEQLSPVAVNTSSPVPSATLFSLEELRERVTLDLTEQGGMFIPRTSIEPLSATTVRIVSLVLATSRGDELLDFTYDIDRKEVSDIIRGSTRYPYAVPLQQFVEWVRRE
ncbi:hypothetical protein A3H22_01740 [Candidatus Peribacteria bacterium RIFCSPLOWO2_12_FULL_55_15]|nr:MAG: hypothetical protein A2789_03350 [Candidatus Peribacteria bacterium RIFCSPHIGHO2_01_FULL_54_22]OGJ63415.1 MAG: hypothetical protein A3D12_04180 [Candidatus Peribacteria bacterium RIFCSPHIGHO2_02_FULL_55_24]OGJ67982.1 MAG: hypothetical protein A2947_00755 [Candidatus Peribacteria bacterium RIFCSPLOWO2_01_FULL_54_110]OGJ70467.1 MAG: hypothetical protein A3H90_04260 [Candidatus Peribacteria bacterium RIFCSPLOWO2_02_FULL_55_36]OGJ70820.1 MAG: hypothetical protein A3H22_01740 [Candidatus Per